MSNKIQQLKDYAEAHYDEGFDVFVECNSDKEWAELLASNDNNVAKAKASMREHVGLYLECKGNAHIEAGTESMFDKAFDSIFAANFN